jgi:hypothetical protein
MINHDRSPVSVVTTCTECPYWQSFSFDLEEASRRGANHLSVVHDVQPSRAAEPNRKRAARHAARMGA